MNKTEVLKTIGSFLKETLQLKQKGKYWYSDNGFAKLLFYVESTRFMEGFYIRVGIHYNDLSAAADIRKFPTIHDWHLAANIGYIIQNRPILVDYDISNEALNEIFGKIRDIVVPFGEKWRSKEYLRSYPDQSPWQQRLSKETLTNFIDTLRG